MRDRLLDYLGECSTWSVTPYPRCEFRCVYCITRAQGASKPLYPVDSVVQELRRELDCVPRQDNITIGSLSDAYPPAEERYGVTRLIVAELIAQQRTFGIVTKGRTICRDIDLLAGYAGLSLVHVSLCTLDDKLLHRLDPGAPSAAERLKVVRTLHRRGVPVWISAAPWIPGISSARDLLDRAPSGVTVQFAPLNVKRPWVPQAFLGLKFRQEEVDRLYLRERESVGYRRRAIWLYPVTPISGADRGDAHLFTPMPRLPPRRVRAAPARKDAPARRPSPRKKGQDAPARRPSLRKTGKDPSGARRGGRQEGEGTAQHPFTAARTALISSLMADPTIRARVEGRAQAQRGVVERDVDPAHQLVDEHDAVRVAVAGAAAAVPRRCDRRRCRATAPPAPPLRRSDRLGSRRSGSPGW